MAVVWQSFVDWDPRVSSSGDGRFQHPTTPFSKASLEQILEEINDDLAEEIEFDGDIVTRDLMKEMKEKVQDRLVPGLFPFFRTEFPVGSNIEEYAWDIFPNTELLVNQSDIFHLRRLSGGNYIPFQNQSFTVIAVEVDAETTYDFESFGFLTPEEQEDANFSFFG